MKKTFLEKILGRLIKGLIQLENKISKQSLDNSILLEDLSPNSSNEAFQNNQATYLEALKWGVYNKNVKNIALTGSYGTGKSTILNSFKNQNRGFEYLEISLAKFQQLGGEEETDKELEASIVQQILYFEKKKVLRGSRFERIHHDKFVWLKVLMAVCWGSMLVALFFPTLSANIALASIEKDSWQDYFLKGAFFAGVAYILWHLYWHLSGIKISKISLKDTELIPKSESSDFSIINRHVDELIYYFEATKTDVVFIEDIDRFTNAVHILIKLRELNALINKSKDINRTVTFIYAVKEDLFSSEEDKTKFFDLIVPVIPIINYNNSKEKFIDKLKTDFIDKGLIKLDLIKDIAPYIQDMRTLINMINEFKIYYKIKRPKKTRSLDANRLLALIVYKNIFPLDFKALQYKRGYVFNVYKKGNKKDLYKFKVGINEEKIVKNQEAIAAIQREKISNVQELRKIYIYELLKTYNDSIDQIIDHGITSNNVLEDKNFKQLVTRPRDRIRIKRAGYTSSFIPSNITFYSLEKSVNPKQTYQQREKAILDAYEQQDKSLKEDNRQLQSQISRLENASLVDLFETMTQHQIDGYLDKHIAQLAWNRNNKDEETKKEEEAIKNSENYRLLKLLIQRAYINENYMEYISYFHEGSLTEKDHQLKIKIIENKTTDYTETVNNIGNLVEDLSLHNFNKASILIFEILDYLLESVEGRNALGLSKNTIEANREKLKELIGAISKDNATAVKFILNYLNRLFEVGERKTLLQQFLVEITQWGSFWDMVYTKGEFKNIQFKILSSLIAFFHLDNERQVLVHLNYEKRLTAAINSEQNFHPTISENTNYIQLIKTLKVLNVQFDNIFTGTKDEFLELIYEHNLYALNPDNIEQALIMFATNGMDPKQIKIANKTTINTSDCEPLKKYVDDHIEIYVDKVLLAINENTQESLETIIELLNHSNINDDLKERMIAKQAFKLETVDEVDYKWVKRCFELYKVVPQWPLLFAFYKNKPEKEVSILADYLNQEENYLALSKESMVINEMFDEKFVLDFIIDLMNADLEKDSFEQLVQAIPIEINDLSKIPAESLQQLIKYGKIPLSPAVVKQLRKDEDNLLLLLECNESAFIESMDQYRSYINSSLMARILSSKFSSSNQLKLYQQFAKNILNGSPDDTIAKALKDLFVKEQFADFPLEAFFYIVKTSIPLSNKIELLLLKIEDGKDAEVHKMLEFMKEPYADLSTQNKVELDDNESNRQLLLALKKIEAYQTLTYKTDKKNNKIIVNFKKDKN